MKMRTSRLTPTQMLPKRRAMRRGSDGLLACGTGDTVSSMTPLCLCVSVTQFSCPLRTLPGESFSVRLRAYGSQFMAFRPAKKKESRPGNSGDYSQRKQQKRRPEGAPFFRCVQRFAPAPSRSAFSCWWPEPRPRRALGRRRAVRRAWRSSGSNLDLVDAGLPVHPTARIVRDEEYLDAAVLGLALGRGVLGDGPVLAVAITPRRS